MFNQTDLELIIALADERIARALDFLVASADTDLPIFPIDCEVVAVALRDPKPKPKPPKPKPPKPPKPKPTPIPQKPRTTSPMGGIVVPEPIIGGELEPEPPTKRDKGDHVIEDLDYGDYQ